MFNWGTGNRNWIETKLNGEEDAADLERDGFHRLDTSWLSSDVNCVAYDTRLERLVSRDCDQLLPIICHGPPFDRPLSDIVGGRSEFVARHFCPRDWLTHSLLLDAVSHPTRFFNKWNLGTSYQIPIKLLQCNSSGCRIAGLLSSFYDERGHRLGPSNGSVSSSWRQTGHGTDPPLAPRPGTCAATLRRSWRYRFVDWSPSSR